MDCGRDRSPFRGSTTLSAISFDFGDIIATCRCFGADRFVFPFSGIVPAAIAVVPISSLFPVLSWCTHCRHHHFTCSLCAAVTDKNKNKKKKIAKNKLIPSHEKQKRGKKENKMRSMRHYLVLTRFQKKDYLQRGCASVISLLHDCVVDRKERGAPFNNSWEVLLLTSLWLFVSSHL